VSGHAISIPSTPFGRVLTLRAALGALLVTIALLGVSQAYAHADRPPSTGYVVAARTLDPGAVLDPDAVELLPADLPDALAARAFTSADVLEGAVTLAPLAPGELVLLSQVLPADAAPTTGVELAFALSTDRALGGSLRPGERVDLVASFPAGATRAVAHDALVTHVGSGGDALLDGGGDHVLTVRLQAPAELLDVVEAVDQGEITVTRPAAGGDR
jgi:Flp pilus assembly protein CpaB